MVKTMRRISRVRKPNASNGRDSARLSMLRNSSSSFSPVNAKSTDNGEDDDGEGSEDLPTLDKLLAQRKTSGRISEVAVEPSNSVYEAGADIGDDEEEYEGAVDAVEGEQGVSEDDAEQDDRLDVDKGHGSLDPDEAEDQNGLDCNDRDGSEEAEAVDNHTSSDIKDTTIGAQEFPTTKESIKRQGEKGNFWEDPKDTERLLELLEQFAMREHYVNTKKGGWRNNAFGEIGKHMGKDSKYCSNKYMRLKYKYVEVVQLLSLGVGLTWDVENHQVSGHHTAWSKVKDPKLKKLKGRTFLYKEDFDNLNSVLKFAPSLEAEKPNKEGPIVMKSSEAQESVAESSNAAIDVDRDSGEGHAENEISDRGEDEASYGDVEDATGDEETRNPPDAGPSPVTRFNLATAGTSSTRRRRSDQNWFDAASIQKLVHLLVEYAEDDYYISPVARTWKNGVFKEIAVKIGKTQALCQSKYLKLKDRYLDMEKLLGMNLGFRWDDKEKEVIGSNEAWAEVKLKDSSLHCCRHWKFLFRKEFDKLAEKLNFDRRNIGPRTILKRTRASGRILTGSRLSYLEPSDEVDENSHANEEAYTGSDVGHESDEESPRKKRFRSDTYEKRREAFYLATSNMSAKHDELKAIVAGQLAIQREHVAIHKSQIMALRRHLKTESQLSRSLQRCHIKDKQRRDDLEDWRVLAQEKLQHERFLTPLGKLRIMQTLRDSTSRTDGYLGVMFLELTLRKLWCKIELEKEVYAQQSDYFIQDEVGVLYKGETDGTHEGRADELTLVDAESEDEGVTSTRGSSESDDFDAEESHNPDPGTVGCSPNRSPYERDHVDRDGLENGGQIGNEEIESHSQLPPEEADDSAAQKKVHLAVDCDRRYEQKASRMSSRTATLQVGEASKDRRKKGKGDDEDEEDEELNEAFREIEAECTINLSRKTGAADSILRELLESDASENFESNRAGGSGTVHETEEWAKASMK